MKVQKTLAFPESEYRDRLARVRATMVARRIDALLVHSPENICYLVGFHTPGYYWVQFLVVPLEGDPVLVIRRLEQWSVAALSWLDPERSVTYGDTEEPIGKLLEVCRQLRVDNGRIGLEMDAFFLPNGQYEALKRGLPAAMLTNGSGIVEKERAIKSTAELRYIREACQISGIGMEAARTHCRAGMTENALAAHIHQAMVEQGSEYPGLPLFLSSGHRTLVAHATWTNKVIASGDNVLVELTGVVQRYAGPLFRTIFVGEPPKAVRDHMLILRDMLEAVLSTLSPGMTTQQVNDAAVRAAGRHGLAAGVRKRAGYSVGLNFPPDWGEGHFLDLKDSAVTTLQPGMVFHVPQTLRLDGEAPLALSETVLVTGTRPEVLTHFTPRDLLVV